ncbi:MAG: hypothetical protein HN337_07845 [Deltaproteobacteria bacterium]|jgi:hypothetical protein|nr:hypothetical protein [Deltaproteobacteria bacterium]
MTLPVGSVAGVPKGTEPAAETVKLPSWFYKIGEENGLNFREDGWTFSVNRKGDIIATKRVMPEKTAFGQFGTATSTQFVIREEGTGATSIHTTSYPNRGFSRKPDPKPTVAQFETPRGFSEKGFRTLRKTLAAEKFPAGQELAEFAEDRLGIDVAYGAQVSKGTFAEAGVDIADALHISWDIDSQSCYVKINAENGRGFERCYSRSDGYGRSLSWGSRSVKPTTKTFEPFSKKAVMAILKKIPAAE